MIFFQRTKLRQTRGQRQLLENKQIICNISRFPFLRFCQIAFLMTCQQHQSNFAVARYLAQSIFSQLFLAHSFTTTSWQNCRSSRHLMIAKFCLSTTNLFIYIFALASKANRHRRSHQKFLNFSGKPT